MKFLCGGCRTKYQISDEKIRSKILTIRCKKCGAKILVRESLAREANGTAVAPIAEEERPAVAVAVSMQAGERSGGAAAQAGGSAALASAFDVAMRTEHEDDMPTCIAPTPANLETAGVEWYIAIDGEQSGPFAYAEVVRRVQAKAVIGRHYVWHDGMAGWKRVREMPDLAQHLGQEKKKPPPIPSTGEHTVNQRTKAGGAEVVDFATKRKERDKQRKTGVPLSERETGDLDEVHGESPTEAKVKTESPSPRAEQLDQVLNEALGIHGEGATQRAGAVAIHATAGIAGEMSAPKPHVEDLLAFDKDDIFANVPRASQNELVRKESTRFFVAAAGMNARRAKHKLGIVIGGTFTGCVGVFMLLWYFGAIQVSLPGIGNPFDKNTSMSEEEREALKIDPDDPDQVKRLLAGESGRRKLDLARRMRRKQKEQGFIQDPAKGGFAGPRGDGIAGSESIDPALGGGRLPEIVPSPDALKDSDLSQMPLPEGRTLSQEAISRVINDRKKSVSICYQQSLRGNEDLRGKLEFAVTIEPTGSVSRATIETTAFKGTKLARCIATKIKDWRFPPFTGDAQQVQVPFVLEKNSY
jgi:predicted Zn finger-like uncharacterized protein